MDPVTPNAPASSGIDTFENTANKLLTEHGRGEVQISRTTKAIGDADSDIPGKLIRVNPCRMASRSPACQAFTAAHETAHHVLRHGRARSVGTIKPTVIVLLGFVVAVSAVVEAVTVIGVWGFLGIPLVVLACAVVTWGSMRGRRREEREADTQAATWGYPMTIAIADELAVTDQNPRFPRLNSHDRVYDRVNG